MEVSIVILNYNTPELTADCIKSIIKNTKGFNYEIIVVDNGSTDNSKIEIKKVQSKLKIDNFIFIDNDENLGFSEGNNIGARKAKGEYILFLNSDTIINDKVIKNTYDFMKVNKKVGIASCQLRNPDGSIQEAGGYFPTLLRVFSWMTIQDLPFVDRFIKPFHPHKEKSFSKSSSFYEQTKKLDWVKGTFMMVKNNIFKNKYFDEDYFMYTEDVDICYRAYEKGWSTWFVADNCITHIGGASSTSEYPILKEFAGVKTFFSKHYSKWQMPILRLILKIGALGRIIVFGIKEGSRPAAVYWKAFKYA